MSRYKLVAILDKTDFLTEEDKYHIIEGILNNIDRTKNIEIYVREVNSENQK